MGFFRTLFSFSIFALSLADTSKFIGLDDVDNIIPNSYIVVMKGAVTEAEFKDHQVWASRIHRRSKRDGAADGLDGLKTTFDFQGFKAYCGTFDKESIERITRSSDVDYVEADRVVKMAALNTQRNAPSWGLGRISHKKAGSFDYVYDSDAGSGITIYGVDTGIDIHHPDFGGRATWGVNTVDSENSDQNGHGTHTAGTFAGATYGVAKKARIIAVKVLNAEGTGSTSGVIQGIEWSTNHASSNGLSGKAAMNLSLGVRSSSVFNSAAEAAQRSGIFLAVAAGNDGTDAGQFSPASARGVCTVAATDAQDQATSWSNYGSTVALYAPGDKILSIYPNGGTATLSGTSMASPHVCGVGAYLMALEGIGPGRVCDRIKQLALESVKNPGPDTTRRLLYNGSGA
ncbi:Secreted subtilisin-like serine protease sub9 [Microsporum canis]